jgi:hypothetical protein
MGVMGRTCGMHGGKEKGVETSGGEGPYGKRSLGNYRRRWWDNINMDV